MSSGNKANTLASHFDGLTFLRLVGEIVGIFFVGVHCMEWVWKYWGIVTPEVVWAYTVVTFAMVIYAFMFLCFTRQAAYRTELEAKSTQCAELEKLLMKRRVSSRRK